MSGRSSEAIDQLPSSNKLSKEKGSQMLNNLESAVEMSRNDNIVSGPYRSNGLIGTSGGPYCEVFSSVSFYQQKKMIAQGMLDLALLSANANQLRNIYDFQHEHPYFWATIILVYGSIILQILVGMLLIGSFVIYERTVGRRAKEVASGDDTIKVEKFWCFTYEFIDNVTILGIFIITIVNVFISILEIYPNDPIRAASRTQMMPSRPPAQMLPPP